MNRTERTIQPTPRNPQIKGTAVHPCRRPRGFTLIELMITLAVAVILIAIAIPSFNYLMVSNKLTTTANNLVSALSLARYNAIKLNATVNVAADGTVSVTSGSPATTTTLSSAISVPAAITHSSAQAFVVTPMGMLEIAGSNTGYTGLVADFNSSLISSSNHRCIYITTGTVVTSCTDSATCGGTSPNATCQ